MTTPEAIHQVRELYESGEESVKKMTEELLDISLNKGSKDNISALLVKLPGARIGPISNGGVDLRRQLRDNTLQQQDDSTNKQSSNSNNTLKSNNNSSKPWSSDDFMGEEEA